MSADSPASVLEGAVKPAVTGFEPVIIGFTCNWCSYRAADLAGAARMKAAYAHAVTSGYRFYSYGDAGLLWRA